MSKKKKDKLSEGQQVAIAFAVVFVLFVSFLLITKGNGYNHGPACANDSMSLQC